MDYEAARLRAFEALLDPSEHASEHTVSVPTLKKLCSRGIPERPVQWRPLAWEVLLGVRGGEKRTWEQGERGRWAAYYELVLQTMATLGDSESPSDHISEQDAFLLSIDDTVRALSETARGKWLRQSITYPRGHPFTDEQETGGRSREGTEESVFPSVDNRRAIFRHIEQLETVTETANLHPGASGRSTPCSSTEGGLAGTPETPSLSPEITLSPSPATDSKPTTKPHLRGPRTKPSAGPKNKNSLSLDIPTSAPATIIVTAASPTTSVQPITLVASRTLAKRGEANSVERARGETFADGLTRLLGVLLRRSSQTTHDTGKVVEVASVVYAVFATGGDIEALMEGEEWEANDHAEAETFWCVKALMDGVDLSALLESGGLAVSTRLAKRVFWADEGLYRLLTTLHLDVRNDVFVREWLSYLLARTIKPTHQLLPIWDAIFSEDEDPATIPPESTGKIELLVDICTAMLLLLKDALRSIVETNQHAKGRPGFWIEGEDDRLVFDEQVPDLPADQAEEKTALARQLLQAYPIDQVGTEEVLRVAWEVRQRRVMAILDGEDLEATVLPAPQPDRTDGDGLASRLESLAMRAGSSVRESINPLPRYTTGPLVDISSMKGTLSSGGERLKEYAHSIQESDTAAQVSKVSSNLTAVALMRLNSLAASGRNSSESGTGGWSIGAATKLWSRGGKNEEQTEAEDISQASPQDASSSSTPASQTGDSIETPINDEPTGLFRRDTNLPPSFITPRGSIIYPAGRYRPKANTNGAKPSLQSRLAAVASSPAANPAVTVSPERSTVKPLILSRSAKPASPLVSSEVANSPATLGRMSPSPSLQNLDVVENYVSRRVSISRRSVRSSLGSVEPDEPTGSGGVESTSSRLRKATRDSYPVSSDASKRYHLSDPGATDDEKPGSSPTGTATQPDGGRYQLRDDVGTPTEADPEESRRESIDGLGSPGSGGVTRSKVVRKGKFASKAAHFRLQSAGHIDLDEERGMATVDVLAEEEQPAVKANNPSSLQLAKTDVSADTSTPKSLILPERPERSSSLQNRPNGVQRPKVDLERLAVVKYEDDDEPLSAKDGYGDLLESYAAALESL